MILALVVTGWQLLAGIVAGLAMGIGGTTWWDDQRRRERDASGLNDARWAAHVRTERRKAATRAPRPLPPPIPPRRTPKES